MSSLKYFNPQSGSWEYLPIVAEVDAGNFATVASTGSYTDLINKPTTVQSIVAGSNITVNATDPLNPIVSSSAGGGGTVTNVSSSTSDLTVSNPTSTPTLTVVSSPKLTTARNINGVPFDGTGNITVADATKEPIVTAGTTSQYYRGDKTFQTLDKTAVGLSNVDNTSDANKPVSTAQAAADALKANDNAVVHLAGTETITGAKTFSLAPTMTSGEIFSAMAAPAYVGGQLYWDTSDDTLNWSNSNSNVKLQIGEEQRIKVNNATGSSIANGTPVYISGQTAGVLNITPAINTTLVGSQSIAVTTETIANGATGYITLGGLVRNINTSALTAGLPAYVGGTAGTFTSTIPVNPAYISRVGYVLVSNATTGIIFVAPQANPTFTAQVAATDPNTALVNAGIKATGATYTLTTSGAVALSGTVSVTGLMAVGTGGYRSAIANRTAAVTLTNVSAMNNTCDATTASFIITLPAANSANGQVLWFKKIDTTANTVTIQRAGTDTIDGATTYVLSTQYKYAEFVNNGSNTWYVRGNN